MYAVIRKRLGDCVTFFTLEGDTMQRLNAVVTPACKLPVFLLHYVIAEKGVGHAIYGRTVCRGIVQG